ncbi:hypothetical protein JX266_013191 [Neoarthrinium moseri]|uniref:uncharacterized protein n=1 Tax=Neoarthrinium moseri TaxID=1658444 RepID=UPI001FDCAEF6|nr:uncharacterized protein JN550_003527 [Neoarthrinium moseri]KAI1840587.1 hypothetical protein JX266_013191 [Neoarthrinium moseri]KAI1873274.1 hypothetical protein JN550_003527 [Neoarthrinium moseri]
MSEVQARSQAPASRGRGGGRGGRGGFASRSANPRRPNGDKAAASDFADEDGDVSQLRKQYGDKVETLQSIFSDWSDADIVYALQETDGDVEVAATRISEGTISQWGEVSKPKKTTKPKAKDSAPSTGLTESSGNSRTARGGREGARGGRGARGSDRARGGRGRGAATQPATNGHRSKENQQLSVPTEEAPGWGNTTTDDITTNEWPTTEATKDTTAAAAPTTSAPAPTAEPAAPKAKTWASMLRQSTAPKPAPKPQEPAVPKPAEALEPLPPAEPEPAAVEAPVEEITEKPAEESLPEPVVPQEAPKVVEPEVALPPSDVDLTKRNLDQLPDESHPPTTATAASTAADSWDPRQAAQQSAAATPLSAAQAQHQGARPTTGFAATALKATERPVRVPSYQRRLEQEEAVRLPGNREVDRAAVQFGAFSLNGTEDDIDGDREEAETRAQPPSDSPIQPRASLPPVAQAPQQAPVPDAFPTANAQKPAAALPQPAAAGTIPFHLYDEARLRANQGSATPVAPPTGPAAGAAAQRMPQYPPQDARLTNMGPEPFNQQYGRFGQDQSSFPPKPYDTFGQQPAATSAPGLDSFPAPATQAPGQPGAAAGTGAGAFSSAPNDYSSYYTADQQSRGSYNNYYGQGYGQQGAQGHNEGPNAHRAPFGGYNSSQSNDNLSQYPQSATQQSRYGSNAAADAHNSGHNTPNPTGPSQPQQSAQTSGPQSNLHQQQPPSGGFPYGHPYNNSPFYSQYMNYYGGYGQGGYGGGPYGKGGVYGQPHQYGMSHQSPYEHSSSPATSGFGQSSLAGRDSGLGSSIDNYGRAGSAQSGAQSLGNSGFGGAHDAFNRAGSSSYQSQAGQGFSGPNAPAGSSADDLKPYGESKTAGGPSPALGGGARPGSATNNTPGQSGLPPPQSGAQGMGGFGNYPSHLQGHGLHGNQTGGSGFGQGHGSYGQYGAYGAGQYGNYGRQGGGWGNNY